MDKYLDAPLHMIVLPMKGSSLTKTCFGFAHYWIGWCSAYPIGRSEAGVPAQALSLCVAATLVVGPSLEWAAGLPWCSWGPEAALLLWWTT